jgi:hypothetical protein
VRRRSAAIRRTHVAISCNELSASVSASGEANGKKPRIRLWASSRKRSSSAPGGTPVTLLITAFGIGFVNSPIRSSTSPDRFRSGAAKRSTTSRICASIRRTARGVSAPLKSRRKRACASGPWRAKLLSWNQRSIVPSGCGWWCSQALRSWVAFSGSLNSRFTSSCRVTNQKPRLGTKWTGSSARRR